MRTEDKSITNEDLTKRSATDLNEVFQETPSVTVNGGRIQRSAGFRQWDGASFESCYSIRRVVEFQRRVIKMRRPTGFFSRTNESFMSGSR
jgi:hypothetical protein